MTEPDETAILHAHRLFYEDLDLCGCGSPEDAYNLIRAILDRTPLYADNNRKEVEELIGSPGAVHFVLSALTAAEVLEHGSVLDGSWLTRKGKILREVLRSKSWEEVDDAGLPHNGEPCTDSCWSMEAS